MIRVDIPDHGTFVEFPDGTNPVKIEKVLAENFPASGREQFIDQESVNPPEEKKLYQQGASEQVQRFRIGASGMQRGSRQDVLGIASPADKKARGEADYLKENAGRVVAPVPAQALAQAVEGAGGKIRQVGDVFGSEGVADYGRELAESGQAVQRQIQEEEPLIPGTWANSIRGGMASTYMQAPSMVAGGGLVAAGKKGLGMAASLAPLGAVTGGQSYQKLRERGFDVGTASAGSAVDEAIEIGTELLPMKEVLGFATSRAKQGIKQLVKTAVKYGGTEYLGETLATLGQDVTDKYLTDPALSDEERVQKVEDYFTKVNPATGTVEAWDNWLETMRTTTVQNALMMGGAATANRVGNRQGLTAPQEDLPHESFDDTTVMPAPSGPLSAAVNRYTPPPASNLPVPVNTMRVTPQGQALNPEQYSPLTTVQGMSAQEIEAARTRINEAPAKAAGMAGPAQKAAAVPPAGSASDELVLDEARAWARDRVTQGQTQFMRMVGEQPKAYDQRILKDYRNSLMPPVVQPAQPQEGNYIPQAPVAADVAPVPAQAEEKPDTDQVTIDSVDENDRENLALARSRAKEWIPGTRANGPSNKMDLFPWLVHWGKTTPAEVANSIDAYLAGKKLGALQKQLVAETIRGERERVAQEAMAEPLPFEDAAVEAEEAIDPDLYAKAQKYAEAAKYNLDGFKNRDLQEFVQAWEEYLRDQPTQAETALEQVQPEPPLQPATDQDAVKKVKSAQEVPVDDVGWGSETPEGKAMIETAKAALNAGDFDAVTTTKGEKVRLVHLDGGNDEKRILAFDESGGLAGDLSYVAAEEADGTRWNPNVYVQESARRKGIATAMYDAAEARGGKIPPLDSKAGSLRSDEGQAFREARDKGYRNPLPEIVSEIDAAAHESAASPTNETPEPTPAQIEAGNYKKGHVRLYGLDISIENPAGSVRRGVDQDGKEWQTELAHHYGYIKGTIGKDKDHIDVFIGPDQESQQVFVVDQVDPKTSKLDEHKVMLGFLDLDEAREGYLANYDATGPARIGAISEGSLDDFKSWLKTGDTRKAYAKEAADEVPEVQQEGSEREEEVPDLRAENEGGVPGDVAGEPAAATVATPENNGTSADDIPAKLSSEQPTKAEGPATAPSPAKEEKRQSTKPAGKIAESGEELRYNKRNRMRGGLKWDDVKDGNDALKAKEIVKPNVWPKPDYQQMITDGMEPAVAHVVKQIYDSVAAKPMVRGVPTDADFQRYLEAVDRVRGGVSAWMQDREALSAWLDKQVSTGRASLPGAVTSLATLGARQQGRALLDFVYPDGWKAYRDEVHVLGGNKLLGSLQPGYEELRRALREIGKGWPAKQEAWQKQGYSIAAKDGFSIDEVPQYGDRGSLFFVRKKTGTYSHLDAGYAEDKAKAESVLQDLDGFLLFNKRQRLVGSYPTMEAAQEAARLAVKREGTGKPITEGMNVASAERRGKEHRLEGKDVTSEELREVFGFKGINFGNSMPDNERQAHLNHIYDSAMDLAEILEVPPAALSLNGTLGIAFGAQGSGHAAGHFVPGLNEINLTRTKGAGVFTHEWAHAMDAYFGDMAGFGAARPPYLSVHLKNGAKGEVRPEILLAFKNIVSAMKDRKETEAEATARAAEIETRRKAVKEKALARWQQRFDDAGAGEAFGVIAERIRAGEYGEGRVAVSRAKYVYPIVAEVRDLARKHKVALSKPLPAAVEHLHFDIYQPEPTPGLDPAPAARTVRTEYYQASAAADADKKKPYWSSSMEMFARAFDAFVSDQVTEKGDANSYLSGLEAVAPQGGDRKVINEAFRTLISELETRETEQGTALFTKGKEEGSVLSDVEFDAVFRRVTARLTDAERAAWFTVAETFDELPSAIKVQAYKHGSNGEDVSGVFHRGRLYLVKDRFVTEKWLEEVILHEWHGHAGLKGLFGRDISRAMVELYNNIGGARLFTIGKKHGIDLMRYGHAFARAGYDTDTIRAQHTEEMLAHLTYVYSKGHIAEQIKELIGRIRAWLREHGFLQLAKYNETDIAWLLKRARVYAESGGWRQDGDPVYVSRNDLLRRLKERGFSEEDLLRALDAVPSFAAAWHGSPHSFDKFTTERIGTGEGNQAFGHGLYFASSKDVADFYRNTLSQNQRSFDPELVDARTGLRDALEAVDYLGFDTWQQALQAIRKDTNWAEKWEVTEEEGKEINDFLERYNKRFEELQGHLYQVELVPEEDEYLLWDKPLSEQSEKVQEALEGLSLGSDKQGHEIYRAISGTVGRLWKKDTDNGIVSGVKGERSASEYLHSLGVRGIKYLDGASRSTGGYQVTWANGKVASQRFTSKEQAKILAESYEEDYGKAKVEWVDDPEANYNYVIFNEEDVEVTARFALRRQVDQLSSQSLLKKVGQFLNPLDFSRFEQAAQRHLPEDAKNFLDYLLQTPFWKKEKHPAARPFYDEFADREVKRFDFNIRMFGGLVDQEGKRTVMEKLRSVVQWTDKVTSFGKLREDLYEPLSKAEKEAYDVLRFEGDAFSKVYGSLADALRNPRIKAAKVNEKVFNFYQEAIKAERDSFEVKLQIVEENMEEAGVDPEKIRGHIAEHRLKYAEMEGWVHRDHGEGDHVVQVHRVIDRLDFSMDQVQHQGEETDRIRLAYYPGHALTKKIEDAIEPFGASFMQTKNGAIIMLFKKGTGGQALEALNEIDLEKKPGKFYRVLVYNRFVTSQASAEKLSNQVKGDLQATIPRNFRDGHTFETSWKYADKVQEYEFQALQTSDMELERVLTESLKKARNKGELSNEEYEAVQEAVVQATAETLLGRGAGLYQIRRANYLIEGYDNSDAIGKYQDYVNSVAGMLSKARYALRQYKHLQKVAPKVRAWAFRYIEDSLRNMGRGDRLSGDARALASIWYLGFSASWMLVNSTQPYTFGQAELSRYTKGAATKIALAEKDVIRDKLTDEERAIFQSEEVLTQERESFQAEMAGQLEGVGGKVSKALHGGARISMLVGQKVEVLNRRTMILAAYRTFRAQGYDQEAALTQAMRVNSTVNIDMGRHNLPAWARKPLGRTFYTLQSYITHALNYLYHRSTSGDQRDQKAILRLLWAMQLMGGLPAGAPGSDELDKLIRKTFGYSPKLAFRGFTRQMAKDYGTVGEMLEGFIWRGIPGALKPFGVGFSLTGAIQFRIPIISNLIAGDDMSKTLTGPLGGMVQKVVMGTRQAMRGDWNRAAEYLAPNFLASIMSGYRQSTEGVMTTNGKPVFYRGKQLQMNPVEGAMRAVGLQPARTADISETRSIERELSAEWNGRRQEALDEYRIQGSRTGMKRFNRELRDSQAAGLVSPLTSDSMRRALGGMNRKATRWETIYGLD